MEVTKIWESDKKDDYIFFNDIHEFVEYIYVNDISLNIYFENSDSDFISLITGNKINDVISKVDEFDDIDEIDDFISDKEKTLYTQTNYSMVISNDHKKIIINKNFFLENKQKFINCFRASIMDEIIKQNPYIEIPDFVINLDFIKRIDTFRYFTLSIKDILGTSLDDDIIEAIHDVSYSVIKDGEELNDASYFASDTDTVNISIPYDIDKLSELDSLKDYTNIYFNYDNFSFEEDKGYKNLKVVLEYLAKTEKEFNVHFPVNSRHIFSECHVLDNITSNIYINLVIDGIDYTLDEYYEEDLILEELIYPIKSVNLSPLEKFVAVFDLVKNFKEYKDSEDDPLLSRYLKYILKSNYMVCGGYEVLLRVLLNKVGIPAICEDVCMDISYDNKEIPLVSDTPVEFSRHRRTLVRIKDEKYGVDAIYACDPTFDNDKSFNLYGHALMTFKEKKSMEAMEGLNYQDLLLDYGSWDEFKDKLEYFLKNAKKRYENVTDELMLNQSPKKLAEFEFFVRAMEFLSALDKSMYQKFYQNYYDKLIKNVEIDGKKLTDFDNSSPLLNEFYLEYFKYINSICNKPMSNKKLYSAIFYVYKKLSNKENWEVRKNVKMTKLINNIMNNDIFPYEIDGYNDHKWRKK